MPVRVKAFVPEGDAVQVRITHESHAMDKRVVFTSNSPQWFVDIAMRNMRDGTLRNWGSIAVEDYSKLAEFQGQKARYQRAYSGDWLIRSSNGNIICVNADLFDHFYDRVEVPQ